MSIMEALDMGKHAPYVWGSYAVTFICIVVEIILVRAQKRTIAQSVGRILRMTTRQNNEA